MTATITNDATPGATPQPTNAYLVIGHGMIVLMIGLVAGVMLIFSLLGAVSIWPLPAWEVVIPGSTRGWQAAHVGGILNGVMIAGMGLVMRALQMSARQEAWVGYGLILTGWGNTLFYWGGNFSSNRGLSVGETPFGQGDLWGALAFAGGITGIAAVFIAATILARVAFQRASG